MASALAIPLEAKIGKKITKTTSPVVKLVALDLRDNNLLDGLDDTQWTSGLSKQQGETEDNWLVRLFYGSNWILSYEACMNGWLGLNRTVLQQDSYMRELENRDIHFFIQNRQLDDNEINQGLSYLGVGGFAGGAGSYN